MKIKRTSTIFHLAGKMKTSTATTERAKPRLRTVSFVICFGVLFSILIGSSFYIASSASSRNKLVPNAPQSRKGFTDSQKKTLFPGVDLTYFKARWSSPLLPQAPPAESIDTYEVVSGACTNNVKHAFALGEDVCARAANAPLQAGAPLRLISIAGTDGTVAVVADIITDPQELIFTLPSTTTSVVNGDIVDNRGKWRATINSTADFGVRAAVDFSVTDPAAAAADLIIFSDSTATSTVAPGESTGFSVYLTNDGPDAAAGVHVTQNVPSSMTFDSATPGTGTGFTCSESGGVVDCAPAGNLPAGAISAFTINYTVSAGAPNAILTTEIDINSTTTDPRPASNVSTSKVEIRATGSSAPTCALACPLNRTVGANTTQNNQPGAIVSFAGDIDSSGDCGTVTSSPASGTFFPVGTTTVNVSSATGGGSCSFTITVTQVAAPTITCAADQTATASGSEASVTVNPPTATGNNVQVTGVRNDNRSLSDPYPIGTTTITWTATECNNPPACDDPNARSASCTQKIIVTSADAPTITCPTDRTFTAASGECQKTVLAEDIGLPSTGGTNVTVTNERSDGLNLTAPYPAGDTFITWTATNAIGSASCTQKIHINAVDNQPPTLTVPPDVSATTSTCSALLDDELGVATATDNCTSSVNIKRTGVPLTACSLPTICPIACPTQADPGRTCVENFNFPVGTTDVTYTATDAAGNQTTGVQHVTVHETTPPVFTFVPGNVGPVNNDPGLCGAFVGDATLGTATISDNCDTRVIRSGVSAGNIFPVGQTTITYTAKADLSVTATQTVTVVDNTPPVVTAPGPVTLYTGPGATSCGVTVTDLNGTFGTGSATDNCPGVGAVTRSGVPSGNNFPVGTTTLTYSATDAHGNTGSATQTVTVIDNTVPVVTPPGPVTLNTGAGATSCGVTVSNLNATLGTGSATDNCPGVGAVTRSGVPSGNNFPVGTTTLTYSATDAHGNTGSANQVVTVVDNTPPTISCPSNIVLEPTCPTGAIATYTAPVGTDNCPGVTTARTAGPASGSVFPIGTTTVTYTATDAANNSTSCSFTVTVKTVIQTIEDLKTAVNSSSLSGTQKQGLIAKLQAAEDALAIGHTSTACQKLADFINSTQNYIDHGNISAAVGNAWNKTAANVRNTISCTSNPCT